MDCSDAKPNFAGMTTNERLFVAGLLESFDDAALRNDREGMISLLQQVAFSEADAADCVDQILAHPEVYLRHLRRAT